ncbi:MAG: ferrous iron transport protein B [Fimbriimonas sp.]
MIAIVGNPNAGKTTLFNSLTGSHQKVGNYPGVTVERVSGLVQLENEIVELLDVPGLYSLAPVSEDEHVAVDALLGRNGPKPDLVVCVIDASNLERNLFLFTQVAETQLPMLVVLTMVDRVGKSGFDLNLDLLADRLTVDVIPVVATRDRDCQKLKEAFARALSEPKVATFMLDLPPRIELHVDELLDRLARAGVDYTRAEVRRLLMRQGDGALDAIPNFPEFSEPFAAAQAELRETVAASSDADARYHWTHRIQDEVLTKRATQTKQRSTSDKIDAILIHRVFGLVVFVATMYVVFQSIYTFATPMMDWIEGLFGAAGTWVGDRIQNEIVRSMVVDGLIAGVGGMLVFLPQILILFFFIGVLEGSGYLARAAFLMDRLLGWCGLNGRAFIPLLSSFACAIPGIMAARVMPDPKSRLGTILVAPLMSCSARLPVYLLLIGAFIQPKYGAFWAGFALFAMHFLGLAVAIPIAWFFNRKLLRGKRLPFMLELPPYQWPKWRDVWLGMFFRGQVFVKTAGTIIVAMSLLIWALSYFPRMDEAEFARVAVHRVQADATPDQVTQVRDEYQLEQSFLGRFGKAIEPVFRPAGFDWRITTAILAAFPARETVVPSLGILFSLGGDVEPGSGSLREAIQRATWADSDKPLFTPWTAVGLMVFFALCAQCMATLAAVKRETNSWKWALFMFTYMTGLAYVAAVAVHQLSLLFG